VRLPEGADVGTPASAPRSPIPDSRPRFPALRTDTLPADTPKAMVWLAAGVVYSLVYVAAGWLLAGHGTALLWFRAISLLLPPIAGVAVIAVRRRVWSGCQWLFWATIALGLTTSAIGLIGWTVDELLLSRETSWVGWYSVFALFGGAAPLFALLAQPHRGVREPATASTAVDRGTGVGSTFRRFKHGETARLPIMVTGCASRKQNVTIQQPCCQLLLVVGAVASVSCAYRPPSSVTCSGLEHLRVGMTQSDVRALLGEPVGVTPSVFDYDPFLDPPALSVGGSRLSAGFWDGRLVAVHSETRYM
jgi:hypothetical protein